MHIWERNIFVLKKLTQFLEITAYLVEIDILTTVKIDFTLLISATSYFCATLESVLKIQGSSNYPPRCQRDNSIESSYSNHRSYPYSSSKWLHYWVDVKFTKCLISWADLSLCSIYDSIKGWKSNIKKV